MKKNDLAAIILIVAIALIGSWILANTLIGQPKNAPVQVEKVEPIASDFPKPDDRVFNDKAVDPTVEIINSDGKTDQPFNNSSQ